MKITEKKKKKKERERERERHLFCSLQHTCHFVNVIFMLLFFRVGIKK